MHIVMLSDHESFGGAAIAASRLAEGLCGAGQQVTRVVYFADGKKHPWSTIALRKGFFYRAMVRLQPARVRNLLVRGQLNRLFKRLRPEVINVHNLHGAAVVGWQPDLVQLCSRYAPTVWTLHDMWSFTGRCAYSYDCRKFLTGCDATCPTPAEHPALAPGKIAGAWQARRNFLTESRNLIAVTPSQWLAEEARAGLWRRHRVETIPNGLPLNVYRPVDRDFARKRLGLSPDNPVLLMASLDLSDRRKGGAFLVEALKTLAHRPLTVVTLGSGNLPVELENVKVHPLGYLNNEDDKVLAYNAADIYVHPALADNLPNTVMEAIACGTPVAGFPIGGIPDMVRAGQTGWLAEEVSPKALAHILQVALNDLGRGTTLRSSCRQVAQTDYDLSLQARRYLDLFQTTLPDSKQQRGL